MNSVINVIAAPFELVRSSIQKTTPNAIKCRRTTIINSTLLFLLFLTYLGTIFFPIRTLTANINWIIFLTLIGFVYLYTGTNDDLSKECS